MATVYKNTLMDAKVPTSALRSKQTLQHVGPLCARSGHSTKSASGTKLRLANNTIRQDVVIQSLVAS